MDRRYDFILHPGPYEPDLDGTIIADLDQLLQGWLGHDRQLTILDLSGVPSTVWFNSSALSFASSMKRCFEVARRRKGAS